MVNFCKSATCLVGKTVIITGANAGIGYETALELAKRGARVILACRNEEKANEARDKIISATKNENVAVRLIKLESMASVREFARNINETEDRLDLLINNAGAAFLPDKITEDGIQAEMAVNYFSHFLLTVLLLDLLKKSAPSRIINVSSHAAKFAGHIKFEELNKYDWYIYSRGKLCQIIFTRELSRRLEGTGVSAFSLHPGAIHTEFQRTSAFWSWMASKMFLNAKEGAQTTLHLALEDGIEDDSGGHYEDCKKVKNYCGAKEDDKAKRLWEISEKMVGLPSD